MQITRVTRQGLIAITFAVTLLWGFLLTERAITQRAVRERADAIRQLDELRRRVHPDSEPAPSTRNPFQPVRSTLA